ncbi:AraC family transcriptional regulator [Actinoplanes sp. NPDC000266]
MYVVGALDDGIAEPNWDTAFQDLHGATRMVSSGSCGLTTGQLQWQKTRTYGLVWCSGREEGVVRDARHIRVDPRGTCELIVPFKGGAEATQNGDTGSLAPGIVALCEIDKPIQFWHGADFGSISLIVPQDEIARRNTMTAAGSHLMNGSTGIGVLVRQMAWTLFEQRQHLNHREFEASVDSLLDLVCIAAEGGADTAFAGHHAAVERSIREYVRTHAHESGLDVNQIAIALGWSVRYIQKVLAAANTTSRELIRQERLSLARSRIRSPEWATASVAHIAHSCGFATHSMFSTAFRQEFGMTPREMRRSYEFSTLADPRGSARVEPSP